ncbi:hypothetical protein PanWU01x14_365260, partial [Parasponia andersonii]
MERRLRPKLNLGLADFIHPNGRGIHLMLHGLLGLTNSPQYFWFWRLLADTYSSINFCPFV